MNWMRSFVPCLALLFMLLFCPALSLGAEGDEAAALKAAEAWLALVDQGSYTLSWEQAAEYFKGAVAKEEWDSTLVGVRKPLGAVVSRTVASKTYATSLPGAPDGEYVVIEFNTSFENKEMAVETVTPMKEADGVWRVSGYYIH